MGVTRETHHTIHMFMNLVKLQMLVSGVYYFLIRRLYQKELNQPKIVDINAASIKFHAK